MRVTNLSLSFTDSVDALGGRTLLTATLNSKYKIYIRTYNVGKDDECTQVGLSNKYKDMTSWFIETPTFSDVEDNPEEYIKGIIEQRKTQIKRLLKRFDVLCK